MAEAFSPECESSLQQALNCPLCLEYMTDCRTLVPCMHTFCTACATKLNPEYQNDKEGIVCPLCRAFIPQGHIKPNHLVNAVLEMISKQDSVSNDVHTASECVHCGNSRIVSKCLHCKNNVNRECLNHQSDLKEYGEHGNLTLEDKHLEEKNSEEQAIFCVKHKGEPLTRNCIPCIQTICMECIIGDHNGHKTESIEEALAKIKPVITQQLTTFKEKIIERKLILKSVNQNIDEVKTNKRSIENQLLSHKDDVMRQLTDQVNQAYQSLSAEIEDSIELQIKEMEQQRHDLESRIISDEDIMNQGQTILMKADDRGQLQEIQSGFMRTITTFQQQMQQDSPIKDLRLYIFVPGNVTLDQFSLGQISCKQPVNSQKTASTSNIVTKSESLPQTAVLNIQNITDKSHKNALHSDNIINKFLQDDAIKTPQQDNAAIATSQDNAVIADTSDNAKNASSDNAKNALESSNAINAPPSDNAKNAPVLDNVKNESFSDNVKNESFQNNAAKVLSKDNAKFDYQFYSIGHAAKLNLNSVSDNTCNYRFSKENISNMMAKPLEKITEITLKSYCYRLCLFKEEIWLPIRGKNSIQIFSLDGSKQRKVHLDIASGPCSLHPLGSDNLVLAAESGLYILNCEGGVEEKLCDRSFFDIAVSNNLVGTVDHKQNTVYLWDICDNDWRVVFTCDLNSYPECLYTLCFNNAHMLLSGDDTIHKYAMVGKCLAQYKIPAIRKPKLCMCDENGNLLVTDRYGDTVHVLSDTGEEVASVTVDPCPGDAVIYFDSLYVLYGGKVTIYKLTGLLYL